MTINTDDKKIEELLTRGVDEVIEVENLRKKLKSGRELRIKLGIDPTSPNLHIGRSVPLLKLRDFQYLGHKIIFLIGDFTGVIGDTSDKESERPMLERDVVAENMRTYAEQAGKILDMDRCEVVRNSAWLGKLNYGDVGEHANAFSLAEFIARDNIRRRLEAGTRVSLREVLYPLMQGYDSVELRADVEVGGTDQRFNLLAGRRLQEHYGQEPQDIVTNPLVEGLDGRKMSSSWGNTINLMDEPNEMFGKAMKVPDELIVKYLTMMTRMPMGEVTEIKRSLDAGSNPRDAKVILAKELVRMYHSSTSADEAEEYFVNTFAKKQTPDEMPEMPLAGQSIIEVLVEAEFATGTSDARRAVEQGGVKINEEKVTDISTRVKAGDVVQKGKRFFVRVV
jgi:tyrosyl-tRNA synthetase